MSKKKKERPSQELGADKDNVTGFKHIPAQGNTVFCIGLGGIGCNASEQIKKGLGSLQGKPESSLKVIIVDEDSAEDKEST